MTKVRTDGRMEAEIDPNPQTRRRQAETPTDLLWGLNLGQRSYQGASRRQKERSF